MPGPYLRCNSKFKIIAFLCATASIAVADQVLDVNGFLER